MSTRLSKGLLFVEDCLQSLDPWAPKKHRLHRLLKMRDGCG